MARQPIVVKIDRPYGGPAPIDVVALVRWLRARGVPVVPPASGVQRVVVGGCVVTFWRYLPQRREIVAADLAGPLALLHGLRHRPAQWLPTSHLADAFVRIARAIDGNTILSPSDRRLLRAERNRLAARSDEIAYPLAQGLIHGDAHHRNTLWDNGTGRGVLCDWESVAIGQPEWDLVTIEVHCRRFAHHPGEYDTFCRDYGFDVRTWSGFSWLRDLRELRMITTNAFKSAPGSASAREVLRRIDGLRKGVPLTWNIL
nr:phosphotransferase [Nocardia transvalensis]